MKFFIKRKPEKGYKYYVALDFDKVPENDRPLLNNTYIVAVEAHDYEDMRKALVANSAAVQALHIAVEALKDLNAKEVLVKIKALGIDV